MGGEQIFVVEVKRRFVPSPCMGRRYGGSAGSEVCGMSCVTEELSLKRR